jgi:hypothetical protein
MMELDFKNTIFVIDGIVTALLVAILAKNQEIDCIIEYKQGLDKSNHQMHEWLLSNIKFRSLRKITVSPPFFLFDKRNLVSSIKKMLMFRHEMNSYQLDISKVYVGAITSSVICSLPSPRTTIYYIDHGTGDYYSRMAVKKKNTIKSKIVKYGLQLLKLPNFFCHPRHHGFTLCKMKGDSFTFLDYQDFESAVIQEKLSALQQFTAENETNTLFFAVSAPHDKQGVNGDTTAFNAINIGLIMKNIAVDETVFIKYHPTLQWAELVTTDLVHKLREKGYKAYDVNEFFNHKEGLFIPAEAILKYCNFTKIVGKESSTLWNTAHCPDLLRIADYSHDVTWEKYVVALNQLVGNKIMDRSSRGNQVILNE